LLLLLLLARCCCCLLEFRCHLSPEAVLQSLQGEHEG
jgi:hypothetical protein